MQPGSGSKQADLGCVPLSPLFVGHVRWKHLHRVTTCVRNATVGKPVVVTGMGVSNWDEVKECYETLCCRSNAAFHGIDIPLPGASLAIGYGGCCVGLCGLLPVQPVLKNIDALSRSELSCWKMTNQIGSGTTRSISVDRMPMPGLH